MVRVTQLDIAKKVGVSREAVAFALSPDPRLNRKLSKETLQRIIETTQQMQYVPNHAARRLLQSRSPRRSRQFDQAGFLNIAPRSATDTGPDTGMDISCLQMLQGAESILGACHASITFVRVAEPQDWDKVNRMMRSELVDGWLLYGCITDEVLSRLHDGKAPAVIVGDHRCSRAVNAVNYDHQAVGRLAVEHLAGLGHRRIGYFAEGRRFVYQELALAGFRTSMRELGLAVYDEQVCVHEQFKYDSFLDWVRDPVLRPTALFALERDWAAEMHCLLAGIGMAVPAEISLLGCDTTRPAGKPTLTNIHLPMTEVGKKGADLLLRLTKEEPKPPIQEWLAPSLILGGSTAPPPE